MEHEQCCLVNLAVRHCKVKIQFEFLHDQLSSTNFAIFDVLCANILHSNVPEVEA